MTPSSTETSDTAPESRWSSRLVFLLAAVGAAVGLGNLWRFPFQTGQHGGAAFVLLYLVCVIAIGLPVLLGELAIGRSQRGSAVRSVRRLSREAKRSELWAAGAWLGASASILVLPIYSLIAGKIMAFAVMSFAGLLSDKQTTPPALYGGDFSAALWMAAFLSLTVLIVARGLKNGIELAVSTLMPLFFLMLILLSVYALFIGDSSAAFDYLFSPRFSDVTPETLLAALGQALFSLAVGGAVMITYGALLDDAPRLGVNAAYIAGADTLVALTAGLMIFPVIFAYNLDPQAGMGLIFEALPPVFLSLPGGRFIGGLFFTLAFVAALTSSISMLMMSVTISEDEFGWKRTRGIQIFGGLALILGVLSAFNHALSEWLDFGVGSILLPLGALASAIIAGWVAPRSVMRLQMKDLSEPAFQFWRFIIRYAAPTAIAMIFSFGVDAKFNLGLAHFLARLF